jgi:subtilisin-like proprotein convertase family protein
LAIPFTINDADTPVNNLTVSGSSNNTTLVPNANIVFGGSGANRTVTVSPAANQTGSTTITVSVSDGELSASTSFVVTVSSPFTGTQVFNNAAAITIPSVGKATPYPAVINVSGMGGTISNVTVTLQNLSHTYPADIDVLLVGPGGQKAVIFSDVGGGGDVNNVTVTLSDAAATALTAAGQIVSGTFKPTNVEPGDTGELDNFSAPAPGGPYGTALSTFNGVGANGTWSLYVVDDGTGDLGSFAGGWSLTITTVSGNSPAAPTISDIGDQWTPTNTATAAIPFTVNDADTPVNNLTLSASSSNLTLVPTNNTVFGGSGTNRTLTVTPASDQVGVATITVSVSDGTTNASDTLTLTVSASPPGLVAAYGFNEGLGTTVGDASGNGNLGTIIGPTWTAAGKYGNALTFNGVNGWVLINDAPSLRLTNGETLEAWVYPFSIPPVGCSGVNCSFMDVVMKDSDRYYVLASSDNNQKPEAGGIFAAGKHIIYAPSPLATNTWTHLAVTYDSTMIRFYVNGSLVASAPETALITASTSPLFIGGDQTMGQYFNGRIDEVRVYNRGLSAAEIQADMNTAIPSN